MHARSKSYQLVLGLGANLGDRKYSLQRAVALIASPDLEVLARSGLYETPAVGPPQPDFLNAAILIRARLEPVQVLARALEVERELGRKRPDAVRWGPRPIDIDILWGPDLVVDEPGLTIPHRHLHERAFALRPLLDVAPGARDPRTGVPYTDLGAQLSRLGDL